MRDSRRSSFPNGVERSTAGLTILEMLVSTAMLSFIVLGLTAMLIQTQKAFKTGIKQNTVTDAGRTITDMIVTDLRQMSDAHNTNLFSYRSAINPNYNFYWDSNSPAIVNIINGVPIHTNELYEIFILEHANTTWTGVGYAVSNYPGVSLGTLYRYQTNYNTMTPEFASDLFTAFFYNITTSNFATNYWHKVADGVIDLKINAYDANGNTNYYNQWNDTASVCYPIGPDPFAPTGVATNALPYGVELEFGILEPDALIQARAMAGNPTALNNFLINNGAPNMEIFRQRISIAAATR